MPRNRATAKKAGTEWESAIVRELIAAGWPHAERRRLSGSYDKGDIAGVVGVVIEAKNEPTRMNISAALNEALVERDNAGAQIGFAWLKRKGKSSPLDGYVVMDGRTVLQLLREAGY